MADNQCIGIKSSGERCTTRALRLGTRCGVHQKCLENNGPNALALKELRYIHNKEMEEAIKQWHERIALANGRGQRLGTLIRDRGLELEAIKLRHAQEVNTLVRQQNAEITRTGVDPDLEANQRREAERERREAERERRQHERDELHRQLFEVHQQQQILDEIQRQRNRQQQVNVARADTVLRDFAAHNQNVHQDHSIKMMKETVQKVLKIPVPEGYRWNAEECSLTPGDIILKCKLTPKAAWQMTAKYCQDEDICYMGRGIYGRVLDSVWQFILNSDHKEDLFKILKQEMEDNIGMCAQGNLTRLCNILSGYSEDITVKESVSETLGRLMGKLMEIEGLQERLDKAFKIFAEVKLPIDEWEVWLDPLLDNGGAVSYKVEHVKNEDGEVIGFKPVADYIN